MMRGMDSNHRSPVGTASFETAPFTRDPCAIERRFAYNEPAYYGPVYYGPGDYRHTPANTVRCNDLLSANPSPGLMTLGY
jgi:hypothetical protein